MIGLLKRDDCLVFTALRLQFVESGDARPIVHQTCKQKDSNISEFAYVCIGFFVINRLKSVDYPFPH